MQQARTVQYDEPMWEPLEALVGYDIADGFMWMDELELEDGSRVQAYKSIATRRYLYLGNDGRAFMYRGEGRFEAAEPGEALEHVFANWENLLPAPSNPEAVRALLADYGSAARRRSETPE